MAQKLSTPRGTRDFSQAETARRNYIFDTCRDVFRLYGYAPIETPAMENLSTLMGKYGDEGDKLIFKIINSKEDYFSLSDSEKDILEERGDNTNSDIFESLRATLLKRHGMEYSTKGLRYDLTVPFARYVVQHQGDIALPFKRYQIQPVWRADRPQKGRYREFFQCDVDVIGSRSLVCEVELVQIVRDVFARLGIGVTLKLNNRKILAGIAEVIGHPDKLVDITVAIDKLEKIGLQAVKAELAERGVSAEGVAKLEPILALQGSVGEKLAELEELLKGCEVGLEGVREMRDIFDMVEELGDPSQSRSAFRLDVELDLSLARGLNYYTGTIFEVKARDWAIGSICGGGRYDDLTGIFGMPGTSGVGISFGADRIYDVMEGLGLFPAEAVGGARVMFVNFGGRGASRTGDASRTGSASRTGNSADIVSLKLLAEVRAAGVAAEIYPDAAKMKRQMEWANKRSVPFVAIVGEEETAAGVVTLKNMQTGEQQQVAFDKLVQILK